MAGTSDIGGKIKVYNEFDCDRCNVWDNHCHSVTLPRNRVAINAFMENLKIDFVDRKTRIVSFTFNLLNVNVGFLTQVQQRN